MWRQQTRHPTRELHDAASLTDHRLLAGHMGVRVVRRRRHRYCRDTANAVRIATDVAKRSLKRLAQQSGVEVRSWSVNP